MGAQDNTEKVLRSLHVLLSKSEPYPKEPSKVIIDKQQVIDLLAELNTCIYQIMDEYELTIRSRDKAERDFFFFFFLFFSMPLHGLVLFP